MAFIERVGLRGEMALGHERDYIRMRSEREVTSLELLHVSFQLRRFHRVRFRFVNHIFYLLPTSKLFDSFVF
jgi:hypothetical protein